jgi:hypothetical protein
VSENDYIQERFEIRQAVNIVLLADECIRDYLAKARVEMDADNWQDATVSMMTARECMIAASGSVERLDGALSLIIEKIGKEKLGEKVN